jgi:hypothetical protein
MRTEDDAKRVQRTLFERYRIHTVWRGGIARGPTIRVTPGLYSTPTDVDALAAALRADRAMFIQAARGLIRRSLCGLYVGRPLPHGALTRLRGH